MELIFASHNAHKADEIKLLLPSFINLKTLKDIQYYHEIDETGSTLEENALIKAQAIYSATKLNVFADDSGLEVRALNGQPGVYSARYAGEDGNSEANIRKLLTELAEKEDRSAQFRCCIALIFKGKKYVFNGIIRGKIIEERKGNSGFGYDSVFVPEGSIQTFAEMPLCVKNTISHRTLAIKQMVDYIEKHLI